MHRVDKPIPEKSKSEIEKRLQGMGDYVKMSYLQRALGSNLDFDTRKFVLIKLAEIYEKRGMFLEGAKMLKGAAEINTTFKKKSEDYMQVVDLYIKGGDYIEADRMFGQAVALCKGREKEEMKKQLKDFYINQAKSHLSNDKRNYARLALEKALTLDLDSEDKKYAHEQLLELYNKLGLIKEYYSLKNNI